MRVLHAHTGAATLSMLRLKRLQALNKYMMPAGVLGNLLEQNAICRDQIDSVAVSMRSVVRDNFLGAGTLGKQPREFLEETTGYRSQGR